jgi:hypothetical protein
MQIKITRHDTIPSCFQIAATKACHSLGVAPSNKVGLLDLVDKLRLARLDTAGNCKLV